MKSGFIGSLVRPIKSRVGEFRIDHCLPVFTFALLLLWLNPRGSCCGCQHFSKSSLVGTTGSWSAGSNALTTGVIKAGILKDYSCIVVARPWEFTIQCQKPSCSQ